MNYLYLIFSCVYFLSFSLVEAKGFDPRTTTLEELDSKITKLKQKQEIISDTEQKETFTEQINILSQLKERPNDETKIKEYFNAKNKRFLLKLGVKMGHSFNPEKIDTIVVGCNMHEHEVHFWGGDYSSENQKSGFLHRETFPPHISILKGDALIPHFPLIPHFHFTDITPSKSCPTIKPLSRDARFSSKEEALEYAFSMEGGKLRRPVDPLWEVEPTQTLYINSSSFGYNAFNHLQGSFEKITSLPFLKNIQKIIIEYNYGRPAETYQTFIQNAYKILQPKGMLLMEVVAPITRYNTITEWFQGLPVEIDRPDMTMTRFVSVLPVQMIKKS